MPVSNPSGLLGAPAATPTGMNVLMVPRCTMTFKKCAGGMKIVCAVRRQGLGDHAPEPVHDDAGRPVQLLLHDERHGRVLLQSGHGDVQVRTHGRRGMRHVHERRPSVLRDDRGLLRVHDLDDQSRLHLLPDVQQHAGLLRLLKCSLPACRLARRQSWAKRRLSSQRFAGPRSTDRRLILTDAAHTATGWTGRGSLARQCRVIGLCDSTRLRHRPIIRR